MHCPHCNNTATIRSSRTITETSREAYLQCLNVSCAHTWRVVISAICTIAPSQTPNPKVFIPLSTRADAARDKSPAAGETNPHKPARTGTRPDDGQQHALDFGDPEPNRYLVPAGHDG